MPASLIVGLGRAGSGLHLPALHRLPAAIRAPGDPVLGLDPHLDPGADLPGLTRVTSVAEAASRADAATTVVHLCTPPTDRAEIAATLAAYGFRRLIVEKPLAADEDELDALLAVIREHRLCVVPVSQWLDSALTTRIEKIVADGELGRLTSLAFRQHKPRFARGLRDREHPTAFDVEAPHALGVALWLAGAGRVRNAGWDDLRTEDGLAPRLGAAWMTLAHAGGVRTRIDSDLTAPIRERRVHARFTGGKLTGWYPCSEADHHAQLVVDDGRRRTRVTFADDAMSACLADAYRHFATSAGRDIAGVAFRLAVNAEVVRLLAEAKRRAGMRAGLQAGTRAGPQAGPQAGTGAGPQAGTGAGPQAGTGAGMPAGLREAVR
ncbi:Gfo/Idh/MocA family oxidoreductase [Actinoplanes rectilineatus]|uniref:Gfo/Idh/MocA family oxidoreductase n=1 Tax=Actinoplanes rectilineatus TaxID=113571 RepID=UPI000696146D|nr:Gfo/Idh/MocA family oxidoreductase [Actinoplanes rectilineatus]